MSAESIFPHIIDRFVGDKADYFLKLKHTVEHYVDHPTVKIQCLRI